ncbi:hypothetical protein AAMO2058_000715800 [Amorphochlora amoebiformis]
MLTTITKMFSSIPAEHRKEISGEKAVSGQGEAKETTLEFSFTPAQKSGTAEDFDGEKSKNNTENVDSCKLNESQSLEAEEGPDSLSSDEESHDTKDRTTPVNLSEDNVDQDIDSKSQNMDAKGQELQSRVKIQVLQQMSVDNPQLTQLKPGEDRSMIVLVDSDEEVPPEIEGDVKVINERYVPPSHNQDEIELSMSDRDVILLDDEDSISYDMKNSDDKNVPLPKREARQVNDDETSGAVHQLPDKRSKKRKAESREIGLRKKPKISDNSLIANDFETCEVERIIAQRNGFYLIKWKGYRLSDSTWEPEQHLSSCSEILSEFQNVKGKLAAELPSGTPPPPQLYEIERIVTRKKKLYLVKWVDFGMDQATWHSKADLKAVGKGEMLKKFEHSLPKKKSGKKTKYPKIPREAPSPTLTPLVGVFASQ